MFGIYPDKIRLDVCPLMSVGKFHVQVQVKGCHFLSEDKYNKLE